MKVEDSYFRTKCSSRYRSLQQRVRKFYGLNVPLPYTPEQYIEWVLTKLGEPSGFTLCTYCCAYLNFENLVTDHRIPLEQAGSLELSNLCVACAPCNDQKGAMTPLAFSALRELGLNRQIFTEVDWDSLRGRLQSCLKLAKRAQAEFKRSSQTVRQNPAGKLRLPKVS